MTGREPLRLAYLSIGRHIHTERWLTWFARRGHDVHLLTVQPGPMPGVTIHDITITPRAGGKGGKQDNPLTLQATAKTYRYLDEGS